MEYLCQATESGQLILFKDNGDIVSHITLKSLNHGVITRVIPSQSGCRLAIELDRSNSFYIYDFYTDKILCVVTKLQGVKEKKHLIYFCTDEKRFAVYRYHCLTLYNLDDIVQNEDDDVIPVLEHYDLKTGCNYVSHDFNYFVKPSEGMMRIYYNEEKNPVYVGVSGLIVNYVLPAFSLCGRYFAFCTRRETFIFEVHDTGFILFKRITNPGYPCQLYFQTDETKLWMYSANLESIFYTDYEVKDDLFHDCFIDVRSRGDYFLYSREKGICFINHHRIEMYKDIRTPVVTHAPSIYTTIENLFCFVTIPSKGNFTKRALS